MVGLVVVNNWDTAFKQNFYILRLQVFFVQCNCGDHLTPMYSGILVLPLQSLFRGEVPGFAAQQEHVCVTCGGRSVAATYLSTPSQKK